MKMTEAEKHLNKKLNIIFDLVVSSMTNDTNKTGSALLEFGMLKMEEK